MNLKAITDALADCPCGRAHAVDIRAVEIGPGLVRRAGDILAENGFPKKILLVADDNTLGAAEGLLPALEKQHYAYTLKRYADLRVADMADVDDIAREAAPCAGILSVGSGSLNDICRLAAKHADKAFAIFATAPSMDGFASSTAPITVHNFKRSYPARQPMVIIADTEILAGAPAHLKAAGFGDVIGKFVALADWRISNRVTGEYYCPRVADLTRKAARRVAELAGRVGARDPETAGQLMEALVLTAVAMTFAGSTRPASGAEHIVSHFWEIQKLAHGEISDFHGKKVGIATVIVNRIYHEMIACPTVSARAYAPDWDAVARAYGEGFMPEVLRENAPPIEETIDRARLEDAWPDICRIVREELPEQDALFAMMRAAGAAARPAEADVPPALAADGVRYGCYMRDRFTLLRVAPMLGMEELLVP